MKKINIIFCSLFLVFITPLKSEISFFEKGKNLFDEKKFDLAKFKFEQDIVFNPKNENSYLYLAKIYNFQKNDDQEERNLKTVILLNPKNEEAIFNLALLKIRKSNYNETKKLIKDLKVVCIDLCQKPNVLQKKLDEILKQ
mgnify:CR=1 FL=1